MSSLMLRTPPLAPSLTKLAPPSTNFRPPPAKFPPSTNFRRPRIPPARSQNDTYFRPRYNAAGEESNPESNDDDDGDVVGELASKVVNWGRVVIPFFEAGKVLASPEYKIVCWITGSFVPLVMCKCHQLLCSRDVPYDKSAWKAFELPLRYLINVMQITSLLVPLRLTGNTQAIAAVQRNTIVLSFLWFLYRWKTNVFTRELDVLRAKGADSELIASVEESSAFGSTLLGGLALHQVIVGRWDVLLPFFLFTVVAMLPSFCIMLLARTFSGHSSI